MIDVKTRVLMICVVLFITLELACDIAVHRYVLVGGVQFLADSMIYPLTYILNDVIAELFGYAVARRLIWLSIASDLLFACLLFGINRMPAPVGWGLKNAFIQVLDPLIRVSFAGFFAVVVGRFSSIYLLSRSKFMLKGRLFWLRSLVSVIVGVILDVVVFYGLTFYGQMEAWQLLLLMLKQCLCNVAGVLVVLWLPVLVVKELKRKYDLDSDDVGVNYNPFSLK